MRTETAGPTLSASRSVSTERIVTANDLRWLGEEADGKRGDDYIVVWRHDDRLGRERLVLALVGSVEAQNNAAADIPVRTNFEGTGLTSHAKISITHNGREVDISKADCVFWTQSSFEKFVIPYYTRFKTPEEIE